MPEDEAPEKEQHDIKIYAVKTIIGRENVVLEAMSGKVKARTLEIKALVRPEEIKGYVFIEGELKDIENLIKEIPHARGLLRKPVPISDIKKFLEPKKVEIKINEGDVVEVIGGPFKGERSKVTRYDKTKREVTIELLDVAIPIPITVSVEFVKLLERAKR